MKNWNVRKPVVAREDMPEHHRLKQTLGWPHLVALGVGAIVGTGILTLIGVGAGKAGPAVILSFAIAGVICACAALAYAEVATMILRVRQRGTRPSGVILGICSSTISTPCLCRHCERSEAIRRCNGVPTIFVRRNDNH